MSAHLNHMRATSFWWVLAPLLLLLGAGVYGLGLVRYGPASFDASLLIWFRVSGDTGQIGGPQWMTSFWLALTWLGDFTPRIIVASVMVFGLLVLRRWQSALFAAALLTSGLWLSSAFKHWVGRPRPQVVEYLDHVSSLSFPSGHTLNSTVFYLTVALLLAKFMRNKAQRWTLYGAAISLSLASGISRIALGVHYPTDVIAGWVMGAAWVWLWFALVRRYWPKVFAAL